MIKILRKYNLSVDIASIRTIDRKYNVYSIYRVYNKNKFLFTINFEENMITNHKNFAIVDLTINSLLQYMEMFFNEQDLTYSERLYYDDMMMELYLI